MNGGPDDNIAPYCRGVSIARALAFGIGLVAPTAAIFALAGCS